jgi:hypothetical protein
MPVAILAVALDGALLVWVATGCWRSITRHLESGTSGLPAMAAYFLMLGAVVFAFAGWVDLLARQAPHPAVATVPVVPLPVIEGAIVMEGEISYALLARVDATPVDAARTLNITSPGGLVYAARAIAQRVSRRGLATEVTGDCLSACTLVFLAGSKRHLGPVGRLGFHGYGVIPGTQPLDTRAEEARDRAFMAARGLKDDFLDRIARTRHVDMWFPDRATLRDAGVLTMP